MFMWLKRVPTYALTILFVIALGGIISVSDTVETWQLKVFDAYQKIKPRVYQPVPVRIIDIDDESLARLGQWPWSRIQIAEMVDRLIAAKVSTIAFDIVFAEPDRISALEMTTLWPELNSVPGLKEKVADLTDPDTLFGTALGKANAVTGFSFVTEANQARPQIKAGFAFAGDNPTRYLPNLRGAVVNLPQISEHAAGNGSFNMFAETDGIIRRVPLIFRSAENLYPSLSLEALRVAQGASTYIIKAAGASGETSFGEHTGLSSIKVGQFVTPTDSQGRVWLYDMPRVEARWLPAWKVFTGDYDPALLEGNIVFIGTSAAGLKDIRTTALNPIKGGVAVHAQLVEQILLQDFLTRPDWAPGAELLYLIVLGMILILLMPRVGAAWCAIIGLLALMGVLASSWYAFTAHRLLVDPVLPSAACLLIYLAASLLNFLRTESEKRHIRHAFSHYMSPAMVKKLAENPAHLKLGGEMRNMTLLFADIRGFTSISEQFEAEELTSFINCFLTPMTGIILERSGTIDKYMGDCIMAFWNAPLDDPNHANNACEAALVMRDLIAPWNEERRKEFEAKGKTYPAINIGIGLNTGDCCVGNMGSDQRFDYSVLGDDVNLASRLEGQSKTYGVNIVIGRNTYEQASTYAAIELDLLRVKGKLQPVHIYTLLGDPQFRLTDAFQTLEEANRYMIAAYRHQEWDQALQHLNVCRQIKLPNIDLSALYDLHESRIQTMRSHAPGKDWDGVAVALTK